MRIAVIGGVERNDTVLARLAAAAGCEFEGHSGHVGGRGSGAIQRIVERADLVVIVTDVNSHGAVLLAKKFCRRFGRPSMVVRNCGPARFAQLLEAVAARDARLAG